MQIQQKYHQKKENLDEQDENNGALLILHAAMKNLFPDINIIQYYVKEKYFKLDYIFHRILKSADFVRINHEIRFILKERASNFCFRIYPEEASLLFHNEPYLLEKVMKKGNCLINVCKIHQSIFPLNAEGLEDILKLKSLEIKHNQFDLSIKDGEELRQQVSGYAIY